MTSLATHDFLREIINGERIPKGKLAYIGASLCNLVHQAILVEFEKMEKSSRLTKRELARRIGKKPEQLTRWLSYPGNLTLETAAEILVGMGIQIESLGLENLSSGTRVRFPEYKMAASDETQTLIKMTKQPESNVVPIRQQSPTPTAPIDPSPVGLQQPMHNINVGTYNGH